MSADPIAELEEALIARLKAGFGFADERRALKVVDRLDMPFDGETGRTFRIVPPAIYLALLMSRPGEYPGQMITRWAAYAVADRATPVRRAHGGTAPYAIGSYGIITLAWRLLEDWQPDVECASTLRIVGVENVSAYVLNDQKMTVMALTLEVDLKLEMENPGADIADFLIFHADFDVEPHEAPPVDPLPAARDAALTVRIQDEDAD